jgi:hypothetical protein
MDNSETRATKDTKQNEDKGKKNKLSNKQRRKITHTQTQHIKLT